MLIVSHFQALIADNFGILALFQVLIVDNLGIFNTLGEKNQGLNP